MRHFMETPSSWPIGGNYWNFLPYQKRNVRTVTLWIQWRGWRYSVAIRVWGDKHLHRRFFWMKHDWRRR